MRAGEIREELESYGISTKAFLEKKEMAEALRKARAEGKKPIKDTVNGATSSSRSSSSSTKTSSSSSSTGKSRIERIKEEMEKAKNMKVGDLKAELKQRGISTKSFFEKSEFARAYAEAVVDGVNKSASAGARRDDEPYDPEYRDVVVQKMGRADPRVLQGTVIDVTLKR
jgi:hypothetical protein